MQRRRICSRGVAINAIPPGGNLTFAFDGNSGGGGVGGNASTGSSFVLQQPGSYLILLKTRALYVDTQANPALIKGQGDINMIVNGGSVLNEFTPLSGVETASGGTFFATGEGSKVISAGPNTTLNFFVDISNTVGVPPSAGMLLFDCYLTLLQLQ